MRRLYTKMVSRFHGIIQSNSNLTINTVMSHVEDHALHNGTFILLLQTSSQFLGAHNATPANSLTIKTDNEHAGIMLVEFGDKTVSISKGK